MSSLPEKQQSSLSHLNEQRCPFESTTEELSTSHNNHCHGSILLNNSRLVIHACLQYCSYLHTYV